MSAKAELGKMGWGEASDPGASLWERVKQQLLSGGVCAYACCPGVGASSCVVAECVCLHLGLTLQSWRGHVVPAATCFPARMGHLSPQSSSPSLESRSAPLSLTLHISSTSRTLLDPQKGPKPDPFHHLAA